jgi:isopenicillin-N N-acyltransferase-like protein
LGRADRLRELISGSFDNIIPKQMINFLSDHQNYPNSVCNHVDNTKPPEMAAMSKASFIMVPEELKIYIGFGPPCENQHWEYSLANQYIADKWNERLIAKGKEHNL